MKVIIPDNVKEIMQKLLDNNFGSYIIGGFCRDILLGNDPKDIDIFTNASGEEILKLFPGGKVIGNEERQKKILTVIVDGIEVSQYRKNGDRTETGNSLTDHLHTCDLTINSIALDIKGNFIDINDGLSDLDGRKLRFVGEPLDRITEDPLRILRIIRFELRYDFEIDDHSFIAICENRKLLDTLPIERVRDELMLMLEYPGCIGYLSKMDIFQKMFPDFIYLKSLPGGDHHNEPVDIHSSNAFRIMCGLTENNLLRLAAALHDIGKGKTFSKTEDGVHFYEHEKVGAKIAEIALNNLKFSKEDVKYITELIRLHMYGYNSDPNKRSYIKFFDKLNKANVSIEDYIMLLYADNQANASKPKILFGDFIKNNLLYKKYQEITYSSEPLNVTDLKIGGKDVMAIFDISSGPVVGKLLGSMFELVMSGELSNNRAELLNYLKETVKQAKEKIEEQR